MQSKRSVPLPFLILILAGIVSIGSLLSDRSARAGTIKSDSLQMQMVEQERMAEIYFRILSWLSDLSPRLAEPVKANPQPAPQNLRTPPRGEHAGRIEFCTFHSARNLTAGTRRGRSLE